MSETAFILKRENNWFIRWFTPVREVPLNGHATLAAASVIFERLEPEKQHIQFSAQGGTLYIERTNQAYLMRFPADPFPTQTDIPAEAEADLGIRPAEYWVNNRNIAVFQNAREVLAVQSRITKDTRWTQGKHLIITAKGEGKTDYVLRYFAPLLNIPEDPVSGVVHCTLAPFWATRLNKTRFTVQQLSARGGDIFTGIEGEQVLIGGPCTRYMEGHLLL